MTGPSSFIVSIPAQYSYFFPGQISEKLEACWISILILMAICKEIRKYSKVSIFLTS